jgi:hypothetical protein
VFVIPRGPTAAQPSLDRDAGEAAAQKLATRRGLATTTRPTVAAPQTPRDSGRRRRQPHHPTGIASHPESNSRSAPPQGVPMSVVPADAAIPLWYHDGPEIEHWFYGVFEGGGAKGVAYGGALKAMASRGCWFKGVAGASAGAITAALIAAGLKPEAVASSTDAILGTLQTGTWAGSKRLRKTTGFFPSRELHEWLTGPVLRPPPDCSMRRSARSSRQLALGRTAGARFSSSVVQRPARRRIPPLPW